MTSLVPSGAVGRAAWSPEAGLASVEGEREGGASHAARSSAPSTGEPAHVHNACAAGAAASIPSFP
jgi:hypothetical protein